MHEIKFRAWHEGYIRSPSTEPQMLYDESHGDSLVWKNQGQPVTIMQYTGLKDKHGKEIYEGDILEYAELTGDKWIMNKAKTIGQVVWANHKCGLSPQEIEINHKGGHYWGYWDQIEDIEIIGNIYENPELI